jgi:REP element-mobilizing transposase RayT
MATPRRLLVDPAESGVFHCVSRCVRRAFLCGRDAYSGRDFEHRRGWIQDRLRELAEVFAVEIHSYSVMSNHLHVVVRTLPQQLSAWTAEEVARRWLWLFPGRGGKPGQAPEEEAIRAFCLDRSKLETCRERLADLSWFMRCLNEPIARRANREDECTGRFWEGRFKCQKLEDGGAVLACMAYVDLNPVRACIAETPEESEFTSAQDRATACRARRQLEHAPEDPTPEQAQLIAQARSEARLDKWLAPLGPAGTSDGLHRSSPGGMSPGSATDAVVPPPLLPTMDVERYLALLDWTGRHVRSGKRGCLSPHLRPVLERLDLDVGRWVENVERFGGLFYRVAGTLKRLRERAQAIGQTSVHGHVGARRLFARAD